MIDNDSWKSISFHFGMVLFQWVILNFQGVKLKYLPIIRNSFPKVKIRFPFPKVRLMEEILHRLRLVVYPIIYKVYTFQVAQDFFHQ